MSDTTSDEGPAFKPWDLDRYMTRRPPPAGPEDEIFPAGKPIRARFSRDSGMLFSIAFWGGIATVLTLGLYRFWVSTKLRRYYWGKIAVQGDPLEYTGTPLEKLLGFLAAIVFLAVYLGLISLVLIFLGLEIAPDDPRAMSAFINLSVVATVPFIFFAIYRAHRYMLARTRWRGIRFGMDNAAWGYTWRAIAYSLLTGITLGILYPYQHWKLAKYKTDRSYFGNLRFRQGGGYARMMGAWLLMYGMVAAFVLLSIGLGSSGATGGVLAALLGIGLMLGLIFTSIRYRYVAFQDLWSTRTLGKVRFDSMVDPNGLTWVHILGSIVVFLVQAVILTVAGGALAYLWFTANEIPPELLAADFENDPEALERALQYFLQPTLIVPLILIFLISQAFSSALTQILVTQPIMARMVDEMKLSDWEYLATAKQRGHDEAAEAGGFADALDVDIGAGV